MHKKDPETGKPVYDKDGDPVFLVKKNPETGEPILDADGNSLFVTEKVTTEVPITETVEYEIVSLEEVPETLQRTITVMQKRQETRTRDRGVYTNPVTSTSEAIRKTLGEHSLRSRQELVGILIDDLSVSSDQLPALTQQVAWQTVLTQVNGKPSLRFRKLPSQPDLPPKVLEPERDEEVTGNSDEADVIIPPVPTDIESGNSIPSDPTPVPPAPDSIPEDIEPPQP